ncbi:MAG: hypothetical protein ABIV26_02095 [Candidatus Limnocylindrales bacterium]
MTAARGPEIPARTRPRRAIRRWVASALVAVALAGCSSGGASPSAGRASHAPAPSGFPMLGSWVTTVTKDDLRAGGISDPGLLNENSGTFTWTFEADGTWRSVQASLDGSPVRAPVFSGWYVVEAPGMRQVTDFPSQYAGEATVLAFEVDGASATVTVRDPADRVIELVVGSHPWTRASP